MNPGTIWLNTILQFEEQMRAHGCLPAVEQMTIWLKLQAITLERAHKQAIAPAE